MPASTLCVTPSGQTFRSATVKLSFATGTA